MSDNYLSTPAQPSSIKKGGHIVINDKACKVINISFCKTGKHGAGKYHFVGLNIFTHKKCESLCPSDHKIMVPIITRQEYQLLDVGDDDYCNLLDIKCNNNIKDDMCLPENDIGENIRKAFENSKEESSVIITILSSMGQETMFSYRIEILK